MVESAAPLWRDSYGSTSSSIALSPEPVSAKTSYPNTASPELSNVADAVRDAMAAVDSSATFSPEPVTMESYSPNSASPALRNAAYPEAESVTAVAIQPIMAETISVSSSTPDWSKVVYAGTRTGPDSASESIETDSLRMFPDDSIPTAAAEFRDVELTPLSSAELSKAEVLPVSVLEFKSDGSTPVSARQEMTPTQVILGVVLGNVTILPCCLVCTNSVTLTIPALHSC